MRSWPGPASLKILREPTAPSVSEMRTAQGAELMEWFADIAERFQMTGEAQV